MSPPCPLQTTALQIEDGHYQSQGHPFELTRAVQEWIQAEIEEEDSPQEYRIYDPSVDEIAIPKAVDRGEAYRALFDKVRPHIGAMRQQLIRVLRARDARFWVGEQEEGQVDGRRIYTLFHQDTQAVFKQKRECEAQSVAVTLLIDLSGSMQGTKIELAQEAAILFAETLHQVNVVSEVIGFTTKDPHRWMRKLVKETQESVSDLSARYARFIPLDDAILLAAKRAIVRPEKRKIVLLLTDGEPYNGNHILQGLMIKRLESILRRVRKAGIECVAFGLQNPYCRCSRHRARHQFRNSLANRISTTQLKTSKEKSLMNTNGNPIETTQKPRRALGRGLREILAEQSPFGDDFDGLQEHVKAARIGAAILELVDTVEARYQPIIFKSIAAYRSVANEESTEEIARKLAELERQRHERERDKQKPIRRWYFMYLR